MESEVKRTSKGSKFRVYVSTSFPHEIYREIEQLGQEFDLRNAEVVRALCLRGLDAYRTDGVLVDDKGVGIIKPTRELAAINGGSNIDFPAAIGNAVTLQLTTFKNLFSRRDRRGLQTKP